MSDSTFDAAKNYKRVCYREDRDLLNTELNEMQDAGEHDRTMILDRIIAPGTILSGLEASAVGGDVTIGDGMVYIDGCAVGVSGAVLSLPDPGEHTIYVDVFRRDVTVLEDPTLVNPLTGEATAEREKWIATLQTRDTSGDPLPQGAKSRSVAPVHIFNRDTGEIRPAAGVTGDSGSLFPEIAAELAEHTTQLEDHETRITSVENTMPDKADVSDVAALSDALNTHKTSADHDGRYYTKTASDGRFAGKTDHDSLLAEVAAARTSDRHGAFASLDARLENTEAMAIAPATYVVAASDSVRKHSAHYICDGTADQVEINQALSALPSGGGKVLLLAGTYTLAGGIEMPLSATLTGEGQGTIVKLRNAHNVNISLIKNMGFTAHKTCIRDLCIDGNKGGQTAGTVIGAEWAGESLANLTGYHRMHDVGITNTNLGVFLRFTHSCTICQNVLSNSGGILITRISTNASVIGNTINYTSLGSDDGVVIQSEDLALAKVSGTLVAGNQMQNCWRGVHIGEGTQMCVVESNVISSCQIGISIASASAETLRIATDHLISGNSIIAAQTTAVELTGPGVYSASVVGNQLVGSMQGGGGSGRGAIELDDACSVMIQSNIVRSSAGNADYGVLIKEGTTSTWVTNNDLRLAGAVSGISDAGVGTMTAAGNQT